MSTWLFDLGNTRLKFAPLREGVAGAAVGEVIALGHDAMRFDAGALQSLPACFDVACVAGVAPPALMAQLLDALAQRCTRITLARTQSWMDGVRIAYAQPQRLGVDRFLALIAARVRCTGPALIVGVGTALTIDLLDGAGLHRGGRIAASPDLMRVALHARASALPAEGGEYAEFAVDTASALASGCEGAALALVARSIDAATALLHQLPEVLVHGGGAAALLPRMPAAVVAPTLVLEGLARWGRL